MKTALIFILFLTLSLTGFAQQEVIVNNEIELVDSSKAVNTAAKDATISAEVKAAVLKINRKKSNEIISIKAYRKSLMIKTKTVKLC